MRDKTTLQPNILLLVGEQHNPHIMGPAGHPVVKPPNLDGPAAEGVYFPNAGSATPLCVPGRAAMLTGRFGHDTGATENIYEDLIRDTPTLPRALREAGYRTCHVGKTHLATGAVLIADHGEMLCDHGCVYKTMMYEQAAANPFIVRWPKHFRRGHVARSAASQVDLAPTLLEAASARPLPVMHGHSLMPTLSDGAEHDRPVFCEFKTTRMIRSGRWKYIADNGWDVQQLFDLRDDPNELNNLVDDHPDLVADLRRQIDAWLARTGATILPPRVPPKNTTPSP
ncbi:MAG: sulfatase [Planctomycetota bacterium]